MALAEVTEQPHFEYGSFRVRGKIFVTVPPEQDRIHIFLPEQVREQALAVYPDFMEKLFWGKKVIGVRVMLARAREPVVTKLIRQAWENKAPKKLLADI